MIPIVSFIGYGNSGKTTFLTKLVARMKALGYKVAVIKHDVHDFEIDRPGKDTWRHAEAGADIVCISSPVKVALIKKVERELTLEEILHRIDGVDIVFTEGFKQENKPKIEVYRKDSDQPPIGARPDVIAVVSDTRLYDNTPHFGLDDEVLLADFLVTYFDLTGGGI